MPTTYTSGGGRATAAGFSHAATHIAANTPSATSRASVVIQESPSLSAFDASLVSPGAGRVPADDQRRHAKFIEPAASGPNPPKSRSPPEEPRRQAARHPIR